MASEITGTVYVTKCKSSLSGLSFSPILSSASLRPVAGRRLFSSFWRVLGASALFGLLGAASLPAQAAPTAYWSAGGTCGGTASITFTPGSSVTASLCATNFVANQYVCDFSTKLQTNDPSGLFKVTNRSLNPAMISTIPVSSETVLQDPALSLDWGGWLPAPPVPLTPPVGAGVGFLLATFTFSTDAAATAGPYTIELGPLGYPSIGISPSGANCLTDDPIDITAALTLTPAVPPPDTTPPVMNSLNCGGAALVNVNTRTITFSATDNVGVAGYECKLNTGAFASCTSPKILTGLADGTQTFVVQALDAAGNRSTAANGTCTWTVDTTPPPTPTIGSKPPTTDTSKTALFTFSDAEAGATFECSLNGAAYTVCTSPFTGYLATPGNQTFKVRAKDAAGNYSNPVEYDWASTFALISATGVPTMSEWGLIILGVLLAGFGVNANRRGYRNRG